MSKTIERAPTFPIKTLDEFGKSTAGGGSGGGTRGGEPWHRQPVGPPPGGTDRELLVWILVTIENELYRFVHGREKFFAGSWRRDFQAVWPTIVSCFDTAHAELEKPSEALGRQLALAGLSGDMLSLKAERLASYTNVLREALGEQSITNPRPRRRGVIAKIRDLVFGAMNSILGSLSKAFPVLEAVKEYKEHVELSVKAMEVEENG